MTDAMQAIATKALMEHCYAGRVDGPGVRSLICRCRLAFDQAEDLARHQAEHVTTALRGSFDAARDRVTAAEKVLLVDRPEGSALVKAQQEAEAAYVALRELWSY